MHSTPNARLIKFSMAHLHGFKFCPTFHSTNLTNECWVRLNRVCDFVRKRWKNFVSLSNGNQVWIWSNFRPSFIRLSLFSKRSWVGTNLFEHFIQLLFVTFARRRSTLVEWISGKGNNRLNESLISPRVLWRRALLRFWQSQDNGFFQRMETWRTLRPSSSTEAKWRPSN